MAPSSAIPRLPSVQFGASIASECNAENKRVTTIVVQLQYALSNSMNAKGQITINGLNYPFSISSESIQTSIMINLDPGPYIVSGQISYFWNTGVSIYSNWPIPNLSFEALECGLIICPEVSITHSAAASCSPNMERLVNFAFNFTPMLPANQTVNINASGIGAPQTFTFTTTQIQQTYNLSKSLPAGTYTPKFEISYPSGPLQCVKAIKELPSLTVLECACPDIKIKLKSPLGCISSKTPQMDVTFVADFPLNIQATNITWTLRDSQNNLLDSISGAEHREYSKTFTALGDFTVNLAVEIPHCNLSLNNKTISIRHCVCPTLGPLIATPHPSDDCIIFFSTSISNPDGLPVKYEWDFGDGQVLSLTDSLSMTHTYQTTGSVVASVSVSTFDGDNDQTNNYDCGVDIQFAPLNLNCGPRQPIEIPKTEFDWVCFFTLILIIIAMLVGTIAFIAQCFDAEPETKAILLLVAAGGAITGLLGIIAWTALCGKNHCGWIKIIYFIFWGLAALHGLGTVGAYFLGFIESMLQPCGLTFIAGAAYFGAMAQLVQFIAEKVGCFTGGRWRD